MNRARTNSGVYLWSLAALLPVAAWFLLTARLAIFHGSDLTASADIALRALVTAQAFLIPLFAAGIHRQDAVTTVVAAACPVLAGLPFAAVFWLAGTLRAVDVMIAEVALVAAAGLLAILKVSLQKALPGNASSLSTRLIFGLAAAAAILFGNRWVAWIG